MGAPAAETAVGALLGLGVLVCCIAIVQSDIRSRRIPNGAVLGLVAVSAAQAAFLWMGVDPFPGIPAVGERAVCALCATCLLTAFESLWRRLHGGTHGMGFGDIKMIGAMFFCLGRYGLVAVFLACLFGATVSTARRQGLFAFGPYLAMSLVACLFILTSR